MAELRPSAEAVRCDERLARIAWPPVERVDVDSIAAGDVVVLCGGFEERATRLLSELTSRRTMGAVVVMVNYLPEYKENRVEMIREMAAAARIEVREYCYDRRRPEGGGEAVAEMARGAGRVFVDISGMSRLLIVQIVVALVQAGLGITIVYGEADAYSPTEHEFLERMASEGEATPDFLSSGIFEVAAPPELGAVAMLGEAVRLVVFPSLEVVQMKNLLQEVQPTYVDVIYGVPPRRENAWRPEAARRANSGALRRQGGVTVHNVSTLDYREAIHAMLGIYGRRSMFDRILVAPTGSKMQAVAVGLLRSLLTDIQIVYPTPQDLKPSTYTDGLRRLHQVRIPVLETLP